MSVGIGIIGLPESGRTTVFNALTKGNAAIGIQAQKAPHIGISKVPDARLTKLAEMFNPKKIVPAGNKIPGYRRIYKGYRERFVDKRGIPGPVK